MVTALIVAAGRGRRLGGVGNKAFIGVAGKPLVSYALETIYACPEIDEIILVVAPEDVERTRLLAFECGAESKPLYPIDGAHACNKRLVVVAGGGERSASVRAGLAEVNPGCKLVLIHDGARPLVKTDLIHRCLSAASEHGAVVAALLTTDTVKEADEAGVVTATLDRGRLWLIQTPQVFRYQILLAACEVAAKDRFRGTDDASLVEHSGYPVRVVLGDADNIKITRPEDLQLAELLLAQRTHEKRRETNIRSGIGYDAHRFIEGKSLVLGGIHFPGKRGLLGHSDADVLSHAICDAILGAMGAGDIGLHFPESDPKLAGVSSLSLLTRVAEMAREAGWEIVNIDATVIAERPRISPMITAMRRALAAAMGIESDRVNIKGKTTEGMGFTGREEGIASQAIAVLQMNKSSDLRSQH